MKKYVAYVGSYTFHGKSEGIAIFDVDIKKGHFKKRCEIPVNNCSYLTLSQSKKYLYAVVDEGIAAFQILPNGGLKHLATSSIRGMRGCYASISADDAYILVSGYHDGKLTVLEILKDGRVGGITAEFYDRGIGGVAERNFRPHVSCAHFTPCGNYICMVDSGIDQVKIFHFDRAHGEIRLVDILHCELNSAPKHLLFSPDGRFAYLMNELKNYIVVYNYFLSEKGLPEFEFKQLVSTVPKKCSNLSAACAMKFSNDYSHLFCSNAGDNSVAMYDIDPESGLLYTKMILPISGDYPKDVSVFPGDKYIVCCNQDSNTLTFFSVDYEKGLLVMNGLPEKQDNPNCCVFAEYGN